jgi:hypothetical protein
MRVPFRRGGGDDRSPNVAMRRVCTRRSTSRVLRPAAHLVDDAGTVTRGTQSGLTPLDVLLTPTPGGVDVP